ncbi:glucosyltransferase domain-containing protein [Erwinia aphidicola]|uniref:glucosyltransferase domain-containing protein n=1 Tax=Erwinia aphidicola TaxID=68334 RepID=UPI00300C48B4
MTASEIQPVSRLRQIVFTFAIALLATLPVWTSKLYYRDDLYRIFNGSTSAWLSNGRPMTWLLQSMLSFSSNLSDISPLNLLIGLLALSIASVIYIEKLRIPLTGYWALIPPLFIILNPFLVQCLLYAYDSLTILFAFAIAMMASLKLRPGGLQQLILDVLLLLMVLTLYQSGLNLFIGCVALLAVCRIIQHLPVWQWLGVKIFALLIAVLIYKYGISGPLIDKADLYSMQHNQLLIPGPGALHILTESIRRYYSLFFNAYPGWRAGFVWGPVLFAAVGLGITGIRLKQQQRLNVSTLLLLSTTLPVAIASVAGLSLMLASPVFVPRMLAAWGVTLLFCFYISVQAWPTLRRWLAGLSGVLLLYHLVVMLACFNTVVNSQRYEFSVMAQIKSDFYRLPARSIDSMAFIGQLDDAPEVRTNIINLPLINNIRMKMLGESEPWIWQALIAHADLPLKSIRATELIRAAKPHNYLSQGPEYDAYVVNSTLVIDFRKSGGVVEADAQ